MKRLIAILFSLLLVWMQAVLATPATVSSVEPTVCTCCDCGGTDCCVTSSSSDNAPSPAAPVRAGVQNELSIISPISVAWILPSTELQISSPSVSPSLLAPGVPIFTRHCALLI